MTIWCYILLILASLEIVTPRGEDYFQENFDENKNCKQEKLIKQLLKDEDDIRCSRKNRGTHLNMKYLNIFIFNNSLKEVIKGNGMNVKEN